MLERVRASSVTIHWIATLCDILHGSLVTVFAVVATAVDVAATANITLRATDVPYMAPKRNGAWATLRPVVKWGNGPKTTKLTHL
jgi:hypothetical protein